MHFGKIADMLWLSQVFENVNIPDMLEIPKIGSLPILQVLDELWLIELWHEVQPLIASS